MAEHTAGPWHIDKNQGRMQLPFEIWAVVPLPGGDRVECSVAAVFDQGIHAETTANARLIAAAPDLLALAKAYEAWEADLVISGDWSGETVRMTQAQHDRLIEIQTMRNAAIAKAKGQAS